MLIILIIEYIFLLIFKKDKKKKKVAGAASGQTSEKKNKPGVSHAEGFFCKKPGHWKMNCPLYIASLDPNRPRKKGKQQAIAAAGIYMINPYNFSQCVTTDWVLDTGSPNHICNSL